MKSIFFAICTLSAVLGFGQKPPIDSSVYGKWPSVNRATISNDGNFASYVIDKQPVESFTSVLLATNGSWKINFPASYEAQFTNDSQKAVFIKGKDSLVIINLRTFSTTYIPCVSSFQISTNGTGEWLAYEMQDGEKQLIVCDLATGQKKMFTNVIEYVFDKSGKTLLLQTGLKGSSELIIQWVNLQTDKVTTIWQGTKVTNIQFNDDGTQLAFIAEDGIKYAIWYYTTGRDCAERLADNQSSGIDEGFGIENITGFSRDDNHLFFEIKKIDSTPKPNPQAVQLNVWSYSDSKLQSQQLKELSEQDHSHSYLAVINIHSHRIIRLQQDNDEGYSQKCGDFVLFGHREGGADLGERDWNSAWHHSAYVVSIKDGKRRKITDGMPFYYRLSPDGRFVIYYDSKRMDYFCYTISTGYIRNITEGIHANWALYGYDNPNWRDATYPVAGWVKGDAAVLLYDQNDIWEVDLTAMNSPVNLTNSLGRKSNIVFRMALPENEPVLAVNQRIVLSAFNRVNKENGYYSTVIGKIGDPQRLIMGPYVYFIPDNNPGIPGTPIFKAANSEAYILQRMNADESPNYFYTKDFIKIIPLSDIYPERKYNWLTTELITWKTTDGGWSQGILYKPENFDRKKKYPIIFYYYERLSDRLHVYIGPEASKGTLNIPWYVSNGYLVFSPDIHYKIGETGKSALGAIVSAANYLSQMSFVDSKHMGIQGHSFGGFETDYIVTHTHLFAAACSTSGISDFVSGYGSIGGSGGSLQDMYELTQNRIGATLWERPDLYIRNSPIFRADQVTTPFLMMHTTNDGICPFSNAIELFTALRRLGKKVWMLQYDNYDHFLLDKAADDFTIRMQQFFDHYLKAAPAAKWMIQGIPAKLKGIENGLELDTLNRNP